MEPKTTTPKPARTINEHPEYFGVYLNLARHNFYLISNFISGREKLGKLEKEDQIKTSFLLDPKRKKNDEKKEIKWNHLYRLIFKHLPLVKLFNDDFFPEEIKKRDGFKPVGLKVDELQITLKAIISDLWELRNDYTHKKVEGIGTEIKKQFSAETVKFLEKAYEFALLYTIKRMENVLRKEDYVLAKQVKLFDSNNVFTELGLAFFTCMFLDKENAFYFIRQVKGLKGSHNNKYIATREVFMSYCIKTPHEKFHSENVREALILDIVNELNKCPKPLYQVLDEDTKKQFKPQLSEESILNISENSLPDIEDDLDYDNYIEELSLLVRKSERFPYLALRAFDEISCFKELRFHIKMGKLVLDKYEKENEERIIEDQLLGFGKLNDFLVTEKEESVCFKTDLNLENTNVSISQFAPHYHIEHNKIGIKLVKENKYKIPTLIKDSNGKFKLKQEIADAFLSVYELPKLVWLESLKPGAVEEVLNNFIKKNKEFLSVSKIEIWKKSVGFDSPLSIKITKKVRNDRGAKSDKVIEYEADLKTRLEKLNSVLATDGINHKQLPESIVNYIINVKAPAQDILISNKIKSLVEETKDLLKKATTNQAPKVGEMAQWLSNDIVQLVLKKEVKQKITSFYFDKIQECLALYADSEKSKQFWELCEKLQLLNSTNGHPFLYKLKKGIMNTPDFYKKYLIFKGKDPDPENPAKDHSWLRKTFYKIEKNDQGKNLTVIKLPEDWEQKVPYAYQKFLGLNSCGFSLEKQLLNIQQIKTNKNEVKRPVDLPIGIFDPAIKNALSEKGFITQEIKLNQLFKNYYFKSGNNLQQYYVGTRAYNIGEPEKENNLEVRFEMKPGRTFQDYFQGAAKQLLAKENRIIEGKNRERKVEKRKTGKRIPDIPLKDEKDIELRLFSIFRESEKAIRLTQEEDIYLAVLLKKLLNINEDVNLKNIHNYWNEEIKAEVNLQLPIVTELGEDERSDKESIIEFKVHQKRKRKEKSILIRLRKDARMPGLVSYLMEGQKSVEFDFIRNELKTYNDAREKVFKQVFKIEEMILKKNPDLMEDSYAPHWKFTNWLKENGFINNDERRFLLNCRNKFCHNEVPFAVFTKLVSNELPKQDISRFIANLYENLTEKILTKGLL